MNQVILIGRLVKEPELTNISKTDTPCYKVSNSIAVNDDFDKEKTYFFNVSAWRKQAEFLSRYAHKGDLISIVGTLNQQTWEDSNGKHERIEIVAEKVSIVASKKEENKEETNATINRNDVDVTINPIDDDELPF